MKNFIKFAIPVTLIIVALFSVYSGVQAQVTVTSECPVGYTCTPLPPCPAGYTCTPTNSQPVNCPAGFNCTPVITPTESSCYQFNTNLQHGSTGADVVALQTLLLAYGFDIPDISSGSAAKGYFGSSTATALKLYQAANGIPATGFFGPLTRAKMNACNIIPTSSITVLSPRDGEDWQIGQQYKIIWTDSREKGVTPSYLIMLTGSNGKDLIASNVSGSIYCQGQTCYYGWTPTTASTNNQISIYDMANDPGGTIIGRSFFFDIRTGTGTTTSMITVLNPKAGEIVQWGRPYSINWTANVQSAKDIFDITEFNNDGKGSIASIPATSVCVGVGKVTCSYSWVPQYVSNNYRLAITQNSVNTGYSGVFSVSSSTATQPSITVLSPNGGETYGVNDLMTIKWNSKGGDTVAIYLSYPDGGVCYVTRVSSTNTDYAFTPYGYVCPNIPRTISAGKYKVNLYLHKNGVDSDMGVAKDSSDNFFTINSGTINTREAIRQFYADLQCREPDAQGWDFWANYSADLSSIKQLMMSGIEYQTKQQIIQIFQQKLGRAPGCSFSDGSMSELHSWYSKAYNTYNGTVNLDVVRNGLGGSTTQPSLTIVNPTQGSVYDNGPSQNIIVQWNAKDIVADYYTVNLSNTYAGGTGFSVGAEQVSMSSNGATFQPTDQIINGIVANSNGLTRKQIEDNYYVIVMARKNLGNGYSSEVARANSGIFSITTPISTNRPTLSLSTKPEGPVSKGQSVSLVWSSTNASSCTLSTDNSKGGLFGGFTGSIPTSGRYTELFDGTNTKVIVTCTGSGGSTTSSVTISGATPVTPITVLRLTPSAAPGWSQYGTVSISGNTVRVVSNNDLDYPAVKISWPTTLKSGSACQFVGNMATIWGGFNFDPRDKLYYSQDFIPQAPGSYSIYLQCGTQRSNTLNVDVSVDTTIAGGKSVTAAIWDAIKEYYASGGR